jgi:four helix bundle protein
MVKAMGYRDLIVYKKAFALALQVSDSVKKFPSDEKYLLTDQIRRSSRSVCSCIAEGYRKRRYPRAFVSKISDADAENSETIVWLEFAAAYKYITSERMEALESQCDEIGKMLNSMMNSPERFS